MAETYTDNAKVQENPSILILFTLIPTSLDDIFLGSSPTIDGHFAFLDLALVVRVQEQPSGWYAIDQLHQMSTLLMFFQAFEHILRWR